MTRAGPQSCSVTHRAARDLDALEIGFGKTEGRNAAPYGCLGGKVESFLYKMV
jgi:hypothetical protein